MKRIFSTNLEFFLQKNQENIFFITQNDPFLVEHSKTILFHFFKKNQIDAQNSFEINTSTNWNDIFELMIARNLFSNKTAIYLYFDEKNPLIALQKHLSELFNLVHSNVFLVLVFPKWNQAIEKQSWFSLIPSAVLVNCAPLNHENFKNWLKKELESRSLNIDLQSFHALCFYYENNLFSLIQLLNQLGFLTKKNQQITWNFLKELIQNESQFTVFNWIDALISQNQNRAFQILTQLKAEEIEPMILLRLLQNECFLLIKIKLSIQKNSFSTVFNQFNVWNIRQTPIKMLISSLSLSDLQKKLLQLIEIDELIKQNNKQNAWQNLFKFKFS